MTNALHDHSEVAAAVSDDDLRVATELAHERYTAARRQYTALYVELSAMERPGKEEAEALAAARAVSLSLAAALRKVEDGDPEAIRHELNAGPVPEHERARETSRFTIAEMHRAAAAAAPVTWEWKI